MEVMVLRGLRCSGYIYSGELLRWHRHAESSVRGQSGRPNLPMLLWVQWEAARPAWGLSSGCPRKSAERPADASLLKTAAQGLSLIITCTVLTTGLPLLYPWLTVLAVKDSTPVVVKFGVGKRGINTPQREVSPHPQIRSLATNFRVHVRYRGTWGYLSTLS